MQFQPQRNASVFLAVALAVTPINVFARQHQFKPGAVHLDITPVTVSSLTDPYNSGQFVQTQELTDPVISAFGASVALSSDGRTALIGAPDQNLGSGAAFIYQKNAQGNWVLQQELTASDCVGQCFFFFGLRVALSGDARVALIGTCCQQQAAYVFANDDGIYKQQQELLAPAGAGGFGLRVALNGDGRVALVGAEGQSPEGAVYVYQQAQNSYTQRQVLTPPAGGMGFGDSLALDTFGLLALIGAPNTNAGTGAAYLFAGYPGAYAQVRTLTASDGVPGDQFGRNSVALAGDGIALVGASGKNNSAGAAYIFTPNLNGYTQQELTASDGAGADSFGWAVTLNGDGLLAVIGAWQHSPGGAAYVFSRDRDRYTQQQELTASDAPLYRYFGFSVNLDLTGDTALIGAGTPGDPGDFGAAYVFTRRSP